jgi:hypothetical protein
MTKAELNDMPKALPDGDICTLKRLKDAVNFSLPSENDQSLPTLGHDQGSAKKSK